MKLTRHIFTQLQQFNDKCNGIQLYYNKLHMPETRLNRKIQTAAA